MKKPSFIIIFFVGVIITLSFVQAAISNKLSTKGALISKIEEEIYYYKTQNSILSEQFLSYSSLTNLASRASELGFTKENKQFVLNPSVPLAVRQ